LQQVKVCLTEEQQYTDRCIYTHVNYILNTKLYRFCTIHIILSWLIH